jgi:hypothetical protein
MANQKITDLTALTGANADGADVIPIVDVSPSATTKKMTRTEFFQNTPPLAVAGAIVFAPGASVTPANNGDVVFELTDDVTLTIKAKGSDGTVRSATITLDP